MCAAFFGMPWGVLTFRSAKNLGFIWEPGRNSTDYSKAARFVVILSVSPRREDNRKLV